MGRNADSEGPERKTHPTYSRESAGQSAGSKKGPRYRLHPSSVTYFGNECVLHSAVEGVQYVLPSLPSRGG